MQLVDMFQRNNISVSQNDLIKLFFKGKNLSKSVIPRIKFFKFIMFSLSKESDQDFINFMRGVKSKMKKKSQRINKEFLSGINNDLYCNENNEY